MATDTHLHLHPHFHITDHAYEENEERGECEDKEEGVGRGRMEGEGSKGMDEVKCLGRKEGREMRMRWSGREWDEILMRDEDRGDSTSWHFRNSTKRIYLFFYYCLLLLIFLLSSWSKIPIYLFVSLISRILELFYFILYYLFQQTCLFCLLIPRYFFVSLPSLRL